MEKISSYSSPFNFGHKAIEKLFDDPVVVQEKIDGSQISFGVREVDGVKTPFMRSRRKEVLVTDPGMFKLAWDWLDPAYKELPFGWTYRGEYLSKPKHNTMVYDRVPENFIILFDVDKGDQDYMTPSKLAKEAERLGLESVPHLTTFTAKPTVDDLHKLIETKSILGNVPVEGIVLKNYVQYGRDKKVLMGKYVSEKFREKHSGDWKKRNPNQIDVVMKIIEEYSTEARWLKAVQHLKEEGKIECVVQDIPILFKEVALDVLKENGEEIKERLFKFFWGKISRGITRGLPEWYKNYLMEQALNGK